MIQERLERSRKHA